MSSNQFARNLEDVTDPTDWKLTRIPEITDFDSLLRCFICKEFLRGPVMTSCNHTFCSQCIREFLLTNNTCPLCDTAQFESNLKRVIQLEEVVRCYTSLRPKLLDDLKLPDEEQRIRMDEESRNNQIINSSSTTEVIEIESEDETEREKPSKRQKLRKENEIEPGQTNKPVTRASLTNDNAIPTRDQMVECPICSKTMSAEILQGNHIDNCLSRSSKSPPIMSPTQSVKGPTKKAANNATGNGISSFFQSATSMSSSSSTTSLPMKRKATQDFYFKEAAKHHHNDVKKLPKLDFNSLNTPRLKEKLANVKLPTHGTRTQLELRYNQYYILFNSNLDSSHPVSDKVLKQKLNQWELSHSAFSDTKNSNSLFDTGNNYSLKNITDKNFSVSEWLKHYDREFKRLTKLAKKSMERKKKQDSALSSQKSEAVDQDGTREDINAEGEPDSDGNGADAIEHENLTNV